MFHLLLSSYAERMDAQFERIRQAVEAVNVGSKIPRGQTQDLRDMLILIRQLEIKPAKGKRRDLKRLESLLEDLLGFVRDWEATRKPRQKGK